MVITIARLTLPSLKATAMRDFIEILQGFGAYDEDLHNKTEGTYNLNGNVIEFISLDQPQKVRGRKRDILFGNEFNEVTIESWRQLMMRTSAFSIIDYNPSEPEHWIYDDVETREDCVKITTTYKDNPHLDQSVINEIERFRAIDPEYWAVYGEGKRSAGRKGQIFTNWQTIRDIPWDDCSTVLYGLDFGFSDPTALVKVGRDGERRYVQQVIYRTGLLISQICRIMRQEGVSSEHIIACDNSRPDLIKELRNQGFRAIGVKKPPVTQSILGLKELSIFVHYASDKILHEKQWYAWRMDKAGKPTNEPIDSHNHAMDAIRYAETLRFV